MARSQNGYPANDPTKIARIQVPGTDVKLSLRRGICGWLLAYVASRVNEVEPISTGRGTLDDWGYAPRKIRGGVSLSNHASGTAMDLNALKHPLGKRGTWSKAQKDHIHRVLDHVRGTVRWGEDYLVRKDGMHFEINVPEWRVRQVVATLGIGPDGRRVVPTMHRRLVHGDRGPDVRRLQLMLGLRGSQVTEVMDHRTIDALKAWQRKHNLVIDGVFGMHSTTATGWKWDPEVRNT